MTNSLSNLSLTAFIEEARSFYLTTPTPSEAIISEAIRRLSEMGEEVPGEWMMEEEFGPMPGRAVHIKNHLCGVEPMCRPVKVFYAKQSLTPTKSERSNQ